ncbi:MAG TPA: VWA domain-containing protein, partial [Burkholderiales bacterium]|nr:VWA domain-containing protein [Burkholderiales bacterium]
MSLSFGASWSLSLLAVLPLFWAAALRGRSDLSPRHLRTVTAMRMLAACLVVIAAAQPVWHGGSRDLSVVYALDVSRSVSARFVSQALDWIDRTRLEHKPARSSIVAFAERPVLLEDTEDVRALKVADTGAVRAALAQDATDLERALDESLMAVDRDGIRRIVLLTDGNQTRGDVWRVLPRLRHAGVRVYPIPAKTRDEADAWLDAIELPDDVRDGEPFVATVRVFSPRETVARVELRRGANRLRSRTLRLASGMNRVPFEIRLAGAGTATLTATVEAEADRTRDNDRAESSIWIGARPRVLYVEGQPDSAHYLRDALRDADIEVQVDEPNSVPAIAADLARFDALILSDVPAKSLSDAQMKAIESYVRDLGGGLLFAGGENTFGEEGYSGSLVEKVLPVEFKAQEKRKDVALVIVIDRSYSMKGRKMEYAKEAARAALDLLEEQHYFGVVAFDSQPYISVPMQQVRSKKKAEDLIGRIQASGQTNIYPALSMAYRMLQQVDAKSKHVIVLSDGDTHPADFERLVSRMKNADIVVSTVTIGEGGNPQLMDDIARWGGGRSYLARNAESIPQIFMEETQKAIRSSLVEEPVRPVVMRRIQVLRGVDFRDAPPLRGHVSTKPRDTAEVLLATPEGAPLLVRWQYGLGRTVLFASDVKNRWAAEWLRWPGYGKLWAQLVRQTMRRDSGETVDFRV